MKKKTRIENNQTCKRSTSMDQIKIKNSLNDVRIRRKGTRKAKNRPKEKERACMQEWKLEKRERKKKPKHSRIFRTYEKYSEQTLTKSPHEKLSRMNVVQATRTIISFNVMTCFYN